MNIKDKILKDFDTFIANSDTPEKDKILSQENGPSTSDFTKLGEVKRIVWPVKLNKN